MVKLFKRRCLGITLWRTKHSLTELWLCSPFWGERMHKHPKQNSELVFLTGWAEFGKLRVGGKKIKFKMRPWKIFAKLSVRHNESHCFYSYWLPLVFVNHSIYLNNKAPISASENIKYGI